MHNKISVAGCSEVEAVYDECFKFSNNGKFYFTVDGEKIKVPTSLEKT